MNKKIALSVSSLGLILASLSPVAVFAEPVPTSDNIITGTVTIDDDIDSTTVTDSPVSTDSSQTQTTSNCLDENGDLLPNCNIDDFEGATDEGLADEPEVVCADENEPDCADPDDPETLNDPEDLETSDAAMWPLILSLSALGATILFVLIINLATRKK